MIECGVNIWKADKSRYIEIPSLFIHAQSDYIFGTPNKFTIYLHFWNHEE